MEKTDHKPIVKFEIVSAKEKIDTIPKGTRGTVVHVYEPNRMYEVEFIQDNVSTCKTVSRSQIE